jgi:hypothetical protein
MNVQRILFGVSAALLIAAGGFQFAPLQVQTVTSEPPLMEETGFPSGFSTFAKRFDLSLLPEPKAPEPVAIAPPPPPDPAASLKQYKFIGLARSDSRAAGVFERGGLSSVVAHGASLEGFTLMDITENGAHFIKDDAEAVLPLQTLQSP